MQIKYVWYNLEYGKLDIATSFSQDKYHKHSEYSSLALCHIIIDILQADFLCFSRFKTTNY